MMRNKQINLRMDEETMAKLESIKMQTGKNTSTIVREAILFGQVTTYYGYRETLQELAKIHDAMNHDSLAILGIMREIKNTIEVIQKDSCNLQGGVAITSLLRHSQYILDNMFYMYMSRKDIAERRLKEVVCFQCPK